MRKIKFRVYDKVLKEYIKDLSNFCINPPNFNTHTTNFIFEQYTGIKDKNGTEIYEGDLLFTPNSPRRIHLVHFNNENFGRILGWNNLEWGIIKDGKIIECDKDREYKNMELTYYEPAEYYYGYGPENDHLVVGNINQGILNDEFKINLQS